MEFDIVHLNIQNYQIQPNKKNLIARQNIDHRQ